MIFFKPNFNKILLAGIAIILSSHSAMADNLEPALPSQGWQQLFDGADLREWQHVGLGGFILQDHILQSEGNMGVLWYTAQKLDNCVIRVVYKTNDPAANSGVFVRIGVVPANEWDVVNHGYEIAIQDTADAYHRTGAIYSMTKAVPAATYPIGQWNTLDIFLQGPNIFTYVNGKQVSQLLAGQAVPPRVRSTEPVRDIRVASGYVGIQNEDDQLTDKKTHVWFKEVAVLPLTAINS